MTTFPAQNHITDAARTEGEVKTDLENWLEATKELPGAWAENQKTISGGAITPDVSTHSVETQGGAASDDLTNIIQTNHPDGRLLLLHMANDAHVVTVKHAAGGAGQINLAAGVDRVLKDTKDWLLLKRTGTLWEEIQMAGTGSPTGSLQMWAGSSGTVPVGWLLADGAPYSRTGYAALFAAIGTVYGSSDASTFRVPNLKGRVPVGVNASDTEFDTLGETGGEKAHTITINEMPSHNHPLNPVGAVITNLGSGGYGLPAGTVIYEAGAIGYTGGGVAAPILQPYIALHYIVKT